MEEDITRIQLDGASARALGLSESDNPFYKVVAMPALSGDSIEEWRAKAEAWRLGYESSAGAGRRHLVPVVSDAGDTPGAMTQTEVWRWRYIDPETGAPRVTTYRLAAEEALLRFPGAQPIEGTCEVRISPERFDEWRTVDDPRSEA